VSAFKVFQSNTKRSLDTLALHAEPKKQASPRRNWMKSPNRFYADQRLRRSPIAQILKRARSRDASREFLDQSPFPGQRLQYRPALPLTSKESSCCSLSSPAKAIHDPIRNQIRQRKSQPPCHLRCGTHLQEA
jgi:hypothetical protein